MYRNLLVLVITLITWTATPAFACLNDRDTLANEANRLPDVLRVITGRFERNPPLYYQMRITRVTAELQTAPTKLSDYDDVGVACDRIGLDDAAIAWMARKKEVLETASANAPAVKKQWYSYYANIGTFWMHRWARAGADRSRISEVETARGYISQAIKINPDAHFGREKYQLAVMNWICDDPDIPLFDYLTIDPDLGHIQSSDRKAAITGLSGLVALGGAWESVDIFDALAKLLSLSYWDYNSRLGYLAELRRDELIDSGHTSMMEGALTGDALKAQLALGQPPTPDAGDLRMYHTLRAEANRWQQQRTDYIMARLAQGLHPDTYPSFWANYHDPGPPHIFNPWDEALYLALGAPLGIEYFLFWPLLIIFIIFVVWRTVLRIRRRRHTAAFS